MSGEEKRGEAGGGAGIMFQRVLVAGGGGFKGGGAVQLLTCSQDCLIGSDPLAVLLWRS